MTRFRDLLSLPAALLGLLVERLLGTTVSLEDELNMTYVADLPEHAQRNLYEHSRARPQG